VRSRAFSTDLAGAIRALHDRGFQPRVVFVDAGNRIVEAGSDPAHAPAGSTLMRGSECCSR
jgi:hypothetical protein